MLPLAANPLQPLIDANEWILSFFHDEMGFSWGAAIIGLTVVVRLAILPLTYRQVRGMQQMQRLAPEMKKIQERFKDDKQRQQQELMKFYQEHNFNPLSSCLPLLLQLPFFLSLYYLQRQDEFKAEVREGNGEEFLFIPDLTEPATGGVLVALILIYIATQLGSSLVTMINVQDKNQRRIMLALPFVFTVVIINFESGLLVYWITTNVWTIGQQLVVKKFLPPPDPLDSSKGDTGGAKPAKRRQGMIARAAERAAAQASEGDGKAASPGRAGGGGKNAPARGKGGSGAKASGGKASADGGNGGPRKPPPPSPRKKKKRSGRRR
ncbi:MAG: membrane protein insertase YidC [Actinomycetota bacterium]|nr:membrane protein insertase YidC [Actinomycetota bacterium]